MKFGTWIPNCRDLATPEIIRRTAVRAEQLGYDSVFVSDHVVVPNAYVDRFGAGIYDPLITLSVLAGATSRVLLGTTVLIVPYRNPVLTAKMVASLDALSGGRVVLGIGAGWVPEESAALGVPFAERGAMTDEYLAAMRELEAELRRADLGYGYPVVWGDDCNRVWDLRRAGQGLMNNVEGDAKPRENVEDTAVAVEDLPAYIGEFDAIMRSSPATPAAFKAPSRCAI